jgi:hypothetical protein
MLGGSGLQMAKKKTEFDGAARRLAEIILDQLATLPPKVAKEKREELRRMAVKASRVSRSGKASRPPQTGATRRSVRSRAKTA